MAPTGGTVGNIRGADLWHSHRLTLICVVLDAFCCQLDCFLQSLRGIDLHVRFDTSSFPISVGDGIDSAGEGQTEAEMLGDPMATHGMRAASGGFAHDRGA